MGEEQRRLISWDDVTECVQHIAAQIGYDTPDCIVGLTRGGLVPAVQLSHMFNAPLYVLNVSLRDKMAGEDNFDWEEISQYSNILIIDDINDSGKTFKYVMDECYHHMVNLPKFAALLSKESSQFTPAFVGEHINKEKENEWIVFPWE